LREAAVVRGAAPPGEAQSRQVFGLGRDRGQRLPGPSAQWLSLASRVPTAARQLRISNRIPWPAVGRDRLRNERYTRRPATTYHAPSPPECRRPMVATLSPPRRRASARYRSRCPPPRSVSAPCDSAAPAGALHDLALKRSRVVLCATLSLPLFLKQAGRGLVLLRLALCALDLFDPAPGRFLYLRSPRLFRGVMLTILSSPLAGAVPVDAGCIRLDELGGYQFPSPLEHGQPRKRPIEVECSGAWTSGG
jgi:hypothetical protein